MTSPTEMIPVKYKKREYAANRDLWHELLDLAAPSTDLGRGRTTSSLIPNLGKSTLEGYLTKRYDRKYCIFTNCATDALDLAVSVYPSKKWYVPSYTWSSPVSAIAKSGAEICFLDVDYETRTVDYTNYDPDYPIIVPHIDGQTANRPPSQSCFVIEDSAQSALAEDNNFGDLFILSLGSTKRMGLLGQGGCILTDNKDLAERLQRLTVFGLDSSRTLIEPGYKTFTDPYNALCSYHLFKIYDTGEPLARVNKIIEHFNDCLGIYMPPGLERYSIKVKDRELYRTKLEDQNIESRVWIKNHASRWDCFAKFDVSPLPISDLLIDHTIDIPMNQFLTDDEVEHMGHVLKDLRNFVAKDIEDCKDSS
jgi:dTDP-4-amino-4,6-dideoxygalactose transaminase